MNKHEKKRQSKTQIESRSRNLLNKRLSSLLKKDSKFFVNLKDKGKLNIKDMHHQGLLQLENYNKTQENIRNIYTDINEENLHIKKYSLQHPENFVNKSINQNHSHKINSIEESFRDLVNTYRSRDYQLTDFSVKKNLFRPSPLLLPNSKIYEYYQYHRKNEENNSVKKFSSNKTFNKGLNVNVNVNVNNTNKSRAYLEKLDALITDRKLLKENNPQAIKEMRYSMRKSTAYADKFFLLKQIVSRILPDKILKENKELSEYNKNLSAYLETFGSSLRQRQSSLKLVKERISGSKFPKSLFHQSNSRESLKNSNFVTLKAISPTTGRSSNINENTKTQNESARLTETKETIKSSALESSKSVNRSLLSQKKISMQGSSRYIKINPTLRNTLSFNRMTLKKKLLSRTDTHENDIPENELIKFICSNKRKFLEYCSGLKLHELNLEDLEDVMKEYCGSFLQYEDNKIKSKLKKKGNPTDIILNIKDIKEAVESCDIKGKIRNLYPPRNSQNFEMLNRIKERDQSISTLDKVLLKKLSAVEK